MSRINYKEHYTAWIDVIAFSEIISDYDDAIICIHDLAETTMFHLDNLFDGGVFHPEFWPEQKSFTKNLEWIMFQDTFVVWGNDSPEGFKGVLQAAQFLLDSLANGCFAVRGGISKGMLYTPTIKDYTGRSSGSGIVNRFCVGPGVVKARKIEGICQWHGVTIDHEILLDDEIRTYWELCKQNGLAVDYYNGEDMIHCIGWPIDFEGYEEKDVEAYLWGRFTPKNSYRANTMKFLRDWRTRFSTT